MYVLFVKPMSGTYLEKDCSNEIYSSWLLVDAQGHEYTCNVSSIVGCFYLFYYLWSSFISLHTLLIYIITCIIYNLHTLSLSLNLSSSCSIHISPWFTSDEEEWVESTSLSLWSTGYRSVRRERHIQVMKVYNQ